MGCTMHGAQSVSKGLLSIRFLSEAALARVDPEAESARGVESSALQDLSRLLDVGCVGIGLLSFLPLLCRCLEIPTHPLREVFE